MTLTADPSALNGDLKRQASALFRTKRTWSFAWPLAVLAYLTYAFFAFDVESFAEGSNV